jgi:sensor histidine kinase YesM
MNDSLKSLFQRFQIRLMLFLLLAGSIPLIVAAYVFYMQSSAYANKEQASAIGQAHELMLARAQREINVMENTLKQIAADYAFMQYVKQPSANAFNVDDKSLRGYVDALLQKQTAQNLYFQQICVSSLAIGRTICSQSASADRQLPIDPLSSLGDSGLTPVGSSFSSSGGTVIAVEPMMDNVSSAQVGMVVAYVSVGRMMHDMESQLEVVSHQIVDEKDRVVYQEGLGGSAQTVITAEGTPVYKNGHVVSVRTLDIAQGRWISSLEASAQGSWSALNNMRNLFLLLFLLLAAVSAAGSLVFSKLVTGPLLHLKGLMKRAELGDLKAYWIDKGIGELNDLGQSYNQMLNRLEELIKQVKQEEALKKEAEMEALQYQLNPHFLYNTLNTIKWVAKIHKTPQISEVVSALVRLLQASLGKKGDFITIREEIGLIGDYMNIQSFRYGDRVSVTFEVEQVASGCLVPRMILQPLVENAILHGIEPAKRQGIIHIRAWLDRDLLYCQVEDNGVGIAVEEEGLGSQSLKRERLSGVGLSHIRQKIKLYYGPDYKMHIMSKPGEGTTIRISLPIHQSEELLEDERYSS